jgi:hypothetical protein
MMIGRIEGATRVVGKSQGYFGLPLRDELIHDTVNGPGTPAMVTAWQPTPEELVLLNNGASVHVRILGTAPPPMMVMVGPAPAADGTKPSADEAIASIPSDLYWLIGKGRDRPDEPLFAVQLINPESDSVISEAEGDSVAEVVALAIGQLTNCQRPEDAR